MSKSLRTNFIKQFILGDPTRPFEEVEAFVEEIGASEEELEEVLFELAKEQAVSVHHQPQPAVQDHPTEAETSHTPSKKLRSRILRKKYMAISGLLGVLAFATLFVRFNKSYFQDAPAEIESFVNVATLEKPLGALSPDPVFANQTPVNADEIFSFPASDITLKYTGRPQKEIVGFFPYWMLERQDDINVQGLTSVNLFGLETDGQGNIIVSRGTEPDGGWAMWNDRKLTTFVNRMKSKKIKVLLTIKAFDNTNIEKLVASDEAQKRFISNAIQLTQSKSLDGINLDFEYVGSADEKTRLGFVRLVDNLRVEMNRQQPGSVLTLDSYATSGARNDFFEISLLQDSIDAFIIMGYDIHTPKGLPGPVSPLEGPNGLIGFLQSYLERVPAEKLILAVPYYGYAWPDNGQPGRTLSFAEVAAISRKAKINWNNVSQTPSFTYVEPDDGQTYTAHFDNARSLGLKYDFVNAKGLQGVGIWALGYDGLNQELQQVLLEKFTN